MGPQQWHYVRLSLHGKTIKITISNNRRRETIDVYAELIISEYTNIHDHGKIESVSFMGNKNRPKLSTFRHFKSVS